LRLISGSQKLRTYNKETKRKDNKETNRKMMMKTPNNNKNLLGLVVTMVLLAAHGGVLAGAGAIRRGLQEPSCDDICLAAEHTQMEEAVVALYDNLDVVKFRDGMSNLHALMNTTDMDNLDDEMEAALTYNGVLYDPSTDFATAMMVMEQIAKGPDAMMSLLDTPADGRDLLGGCGFFQYLGCLAASAAAGLSCVTVFTCGVGVAGTISACACIVGA